VAGLKDMLRRVLGGRNPEEALAEFKEKLHQSINEFKDSPESRQRLQRTLQSIVMPVRYFNGSIVRPHLENKESLKELAQQVGMNKVELKRVFKLSLELEEKLTQYFGDELDVEQLAVTLRKVINVLDEQVLTDLIDAMDYNINFDKIERAQLDYQEAIQKAYNVDGLNRELNGILGSLLGNMRNVFSNKQSPAAKSKPSDQHTEVKMMEPQYQNTYDHYREEGYEHDEAMRFVQEKQDLDALPAAYLDAYRVFRQEGRNHEDAIEYVRSLADKSNQGD
jgi:AraC-like DNA-binding protein